jgi:hypothetical protein
LNLLKPIAGLEKLLLVAFIIRFIAILISAGFVLVAWSFWSQYYDGEFAEMTGMRVTEMQQYLSYLNLGSFLLLTFIYAFWVYRAYQNLERVQLKGMTYSAQTAALWVAGLALIYWLPSYNFWMYFMLLYFIVPFLVVRELYRGSAVINGKQAPHGWHFGKYSQLIVWWWAIWIAARVMEAVIPEVREEIVLSTYEAALQTGSLLLDLAGTFFWLSVMRKITQMQSEPSLLFLEELGGTVSPGPGYEDQISRPTEKPSQEEQQSE